MPEELDPSQIGGPGGLFESIPDTGPLERFTQLQAARGNAEYAWSAIPPKNYIPLFNPTTAPFKGMKSGPHASGLKPGEWALAQNVRPDDTTMMVRYPTTDMAATGLGAVVKILGASGNYLAASTGTRIDIFYTGDNGVSYTQITNGATDMASSSNTAKISFQKVSWLGTDYVIVTGGANVPRVIKTAGNTIAKHSQLSTPPSTASLITPVIKYGNSINMHLFRGLGGLAALNYIDFGTSTGSNSTTTIKDTGKNWTVNQFSGGGTWTVTILAGLGSGQTRNISSNTATQITVSSVWATTPDSTSQYIVSPPSASQYVSAAVTTSGTNQCYIPVTLNTSLTYPPTGFASTTGYGMVLQVPQTDFSASKQLCIASDYATYDHWSGLKFKVEAFNTSNSTWYTIYDPNTASYAAPYIISWDDSNFDHATAVGMGLNGEQVVAFDIASICSNLTAVTYIRFTWDVSYATPQGGSTYTFDIHGIFGSGSTQGGAQFAQAAYDSNGMSEAPLAVGAANTTQSTQPLIQTVGISCGGAGATSSGGYNIHLPYSQYLSVNYQIPTYTITAADSALGANGINVYRKDIGQSEFYYIGSGSSGSTFTADSTTPQNLQRVSGDAYSTCIPPSTNGGYVSQPTPIAVANQRLFVGQGNTYYYSETNNPFRFRQFLNIVNGVPQARSAGYYQFPTETVAGFATAAASPSGASTLYVFTDKGTYSVGGFNGYQLAQPTLLAAVGCSSGWTIQQYRDAIFFVDDNFQLRRFSYSKSHLYFYENANAYEIMPTISKRIVDDRIKNVPSSRVYNMVGFAFYDRYYLAYTPSGGSYNTKILVWDETVGSFVEDTLPDSAEQIVRMGNDIFLYASNFKVYKHENTSSNATLSVAMTSRMLHTDMWHNMTVERVGMVCDTQASQTATVTKTAILGSLGNIRSLSATDTTSIDLATNATGQVWRWDYKNDAAGKPIRGGIQGVGIQIGFTATMSPGTRIYSIIAEVAKPTEGADTGL